MRRRRRRRRRLRLTPKHRQEDDKKTLPQKNPELAGCCSGRVAAILQDPQLSKSLLQNNISAQDEAIARNEIVCARDGVVRTGSNFTG
jgi:hypothetical protein